MAKATFNCELRLSYGEIIEMVESDKQSVFKVGPIPVAISLDETAKMILTEDLEEFRGKYD